MTEGLSGDEFSFPATYHDDPHATLADLRRHCPVRRVRLPDDSTAWVVADHAGVQAGLADPNLSLDKTNSRGGYRGLRLPPVLDANLLNLDPPDHTRLRRLVNTAFTSRRVASLRPALRRIADTLVDGLPAHGPVDIVAAYCAPFSVTVICELLGVEGDAATFRSWLTALFVPDPDRPEAAKQAVTEMVGFLTELITDRRRTAGDDLVSELVWARDGADRLSEDELVSLVFLLFFAGFENTAHAIGNGLLVLLDHPRQAAELASDPALWPGAVEEILRFEPPAPMAIRRFPLREHAGAGEVRVPAGETVLLSIAAANRDPSVFDEPDRFDVRRQDGRQLAFGYGPHFCVGATLGRLEIEVALETLLRRLPALRRAEPAEPPRWRPSLRGRGLTELAVVY